MAAESYHEYKSNGLWIRDSYLEIFLHFLILTWEDSFNSYDWLNKHKKNYQLNSQGMFPDMMTLELDELLINSDRENIYKLLLEQTTDLIKNYHPEIPLNILEEIREVKPLLPKQTKPLPIKYLLEVKSSILKLIDKTIYKDSYR